jgi:glycogen debranching enzyme
VLSAFTHARPIHVDLPISAPGAFCYFIEHDSLAGSDRITSRKGYFNVDPIITLPARTPFFPTTTSPLADLSSGTILDKPQTFTLDSLTILSVLAKWMGPTSEWEKHFSEASKRGYNMLHWAPLQQRGSSGSPYSIFDQLKYDKAILVDPKAADGGLGEIDTAVKLAREKYGLGGVTDVVLNHTAFDSEWLHEHPEAGELAPGVICWDLPQDTPRTTHHTSPPLSSSKTPSWTCLPTWHNLVCPPRLSPAAT